MQLYKDESPTHIYIFDIFDFRHRLLAIVEKSEDIADNKSKTVKFCDCHVHLGIFYFESEKRELDSIEKMEYYSPDSQFVRMSELRNDINGLADTIEEMAEQIEKITIYLKESEVAEEDESEDSNLIDLNNEIV